MMAWGFISRTPSLHLRKAPDSRSAMPPGIFTFRDAVSIPWKGDFPGRSPFFGSHHLDVGNDQAEDDECRQVGASADHEDDVVPMGGIALRG